MSWRMSWRIRGIPPRSRSGPTRPDVRITAGGAPARSPS